jgi:hypothetical protein
METSLFKMIVVCMIIVLLLPLGLGVREGACQPPPVAAPLVREGTFAMKLAEALNVGHPSSEVEAESMLGVVGVAPRNGWMADYPVTPDIIGELRDSMGYAAQAKTISVDKDAALRTLESVQANVSISVTPAPAGPPPSSKPPPGEPAESAETYPDQTVVNNYYDNEGPPIVTYYAPPSDYYYLYAWVPYPFWWGGFWFGGFFILNDFHRHFGGRNGGFFVSNHFNDVVSHRVLRVDPVNRLSGRTFAGIGAPRANNFISTGVKGSSERIFNRDRSFGPRSSTNILRSQAGTTRAVRQPSMSGRRATNPFAANRIYSRPPGGGRTFTSRGSISNRGRTFSAPGGGSRGGSGGKRR